MIQLQATTLVSWDSTNRLSTLQSLQIRCCSPSPHSCGTLGSRQVPADMSLAGAGASWDGQCSNVKHAKEYRHETSNAAAAVQAQ